MKAGACLPVTLTDPKTAFSEEPSESAVQRALRTDLTLWEYYDSPEGRDQGQRFAIFMAGANKLQPPEAIITGILALSNAIFHGPVSLTEYANRV